MSEDKAPDIVRTDSGRRLEAEASKAEGQISRGLAAAQFISDALGGMLLEHATYSAFLAEYEYLYRASKPKGRKPKGHKGAWTSKVQDTMRQHLTSVKAVGRQALNLPKRAGKTKADLEAESKALSEGFGKIQTAVRKAGSLGAAKAKASKPKTKPKPKPLAARVEGEAPALNPDMVGFLDSIEAEGTRLFDSATGKAMREAAHSLAVAWVERQHRTQVA